MGLGGFLLGSLILYLKGMRILMFQLSGIYYKGSYKTSFKGSYKGLGFKGPCTQIVYTFGPMYLYSEYF